VSAKSDAAMEQVAAKIIASIEAGIVDGDWKKPWAELPIAMNAVTGKQYRGGNLIALWAYGESFSPGGYWATYKQWASVGAQVRKGESGTMLVYWKRLECKTHGPDEMCSSCGRLVSNVFHVFHSDQVDGWEAPTIEQNTEARIKLAEEFVASTGAKIEHSDEGRAYYRQATDSITLPRFETFESAEAYYATVAHELIHWTKHESRLDRDMSKKVEGDAYAAEELVAELGSAMLCATLGISDTPRPDHAKYLRSWVSHLRDDYRLLWRAASLAQKAVDHLLALADEQEGDIAA